MSIYITQFKKEHAGLASKFQVNPVSCGRHSHYEEYLRFSAIDDYRNGKGITYILRNDYIGVEYVTLCADPMSVPFYEKNEFIKIMDYHEIPRDGWNKDCIPLILKLPELDLSM